MNNDDHLFQLITSLDQGEKRYISLNISVSKADSKDYTALYDYLLKISDYDEIAVKEKLRKQIPHNRFASVKNYLYSKLLSLLRDYHADGSIDMQLRNYLQTIEVLFRKGLIKQAKKQLDSAKKIAEKHNKLRQLIQIYDWEYAISTVSEKPGDREISFEKIDHEEQQTINLLKLQYDYHRLHFKLFNHLYKYGIPNNEESRLFFREILSDSRMLDVPKAPPYTMDLFYSILNACHHMCDNFEKAAEAGKQRLKVYEDNPDFAIDESYHYAAATNNYLQNMVRMENWEEGNAILEKANAFAEKNRKKLLDVSYILFKFVTHQFKIKILMAQKLFMEADAWINSHKSEILELCSNKEKENNVFILALSIAVNSLILGKNDDAVDWLRIILNQNRNSIRHDIYNFAFIMNLVIQYEYGNASTLEYQVQAFQRLIAEQGKKSAFETLFPNVLKKLATLSHDKSQTRSFLEKSIVRIKKISLEPGFESGFIKQFYIVEWLESKLQRKNFLEYLSAKSSKFD
jgi:hypothetical protein